MYSDSDFLTSRYHKVVGCDLVPFPYFPTSFFTYSTLLLSVDGLTTCPPQDGLLTLTTDDAERPRLLAGKSEKFFAGE
jgi:hypothetical protein